MTRRRSLNGLLENYLGTLTSRYSDFEGYWVLGLIVEDLREMTIDLRSEATASPQPRPLAAFIRMARDRFGEQLGKQRIPTSYVRTAVLEMKKPATRTDGDVNGHLTAGYEIAFSARVESDLRRIYARNKSVFVAPHNADIESRSGRRESSAPSGP
jgi:hypothetical protein